MTLGSVIANVPESSELNEGYVKNFLFDKTVTINSLSKLYFDLKAQTSCPVRF